MWEQLAGLSFKTLSWGGLIAFIAALIPVLRKIQPITTLTSSNFERTLLTKEKRILVKFILFIIHSLIYLGVIGFFYYCFFGLYTNTFMKISTKTMEAVPIVLSYVLFISSMFLIHLTISEKSIVERISGNRKAFVITFLITFTIFIVSSTLYIPSLFSSLVVKGNYSYKNNTELVVMIVAFVLIFFIYSIGIMSAMKFFLAQFDKKLNLSNGEVFFVLENEASEKWYVYYPTSEDLYLLGDTPSTKETNVFKTIAKNDLLEKKIYVQRLNGN